MVCKYLAFRYPHVIFTSDASGLRLHLGLRAMWARMKSRHKIPDLIILHPSNGYHGLCLELKRDVSEVFRKDGSLKKDDHVEAQAATIEALTAIGYKAAFGCGFDHAKSIIDEYLAA